MLAWCYTAWNILLTSSDQLSQQCSLPAPCPLPAYSLGESRVQKWESLDAVQAFSAIAEALVCCQHWLSCRSKHSTIQAALGKADSILARPSPNACPGRRRGLRLSPHSYSFIPRIGGLPWRDSLGNTEKKLEPFWLEEHNDYQTSACYLCSCFSDIPGMSSLGYPFLCYQTASAQGYIHELPAHGSWKIFFQILFWDMREFNLPCLP